MKQKSIIARLLFIIMVILGTTSLGAVSSASAQGSKGAFKNYPLPQHPDTLRILAIGNSFSDDGAMYLPDLLEYAGIHNVIVARLYIGGCSLQRHCNEYEQNLTNYKYYKSTDNRWVTVSSKASMMDGVKDEPWDIITMQQASGFSGLYDSYNPWLRNLIQIVRENCSNPRASIVWFQTWSYARTTDRKEYSDYNNDQEQMFYQIAQCVKKLQKDQKISTVIPGGTAMMNLRTTKLNDDKDLTRDGYHLNLKYSRYTVACTWFETLIYPTLGLSVKDNPFRLQGTDRELTPEEATICQDAAIQAVATPFCIYRKPFSE